VCDESVETIAQSKKKVTKKKMKTTNGTPIPPGWGGAGEWWGRTVKRSIMGKKKHTGAKKRGTGGTLGRK